MSAEMKSQDSDNDSDYDQSDHMDEDEEDFCGYYDNDTDDLDIDRPKKTDDPEYFEYELLKVEDVERLLNEDVEVLCSCLQVDPHLAKMLLQVHQWKKEFIMERYKKDPAKFLVDSKITPAVKYKSAPLGVQNTCSVCCRKLSSDHFCHLSCGHVFCRECWDNYFQVQILQGVTSGIECMENNCHILVPEDFLCRSLSKPDLRDKYTKLSFLDLVNTHPQLRFCPGPNCSNVVRAKDTRSKKVDCAQCKTIFCFGCGIDYHAPTDCATIRKWLTKCADDSETANYISAHTKDCPKCHVCIEKNGGCNHVQCTKCKNDFCWMCLGDWRTHGSEYYECSRYKENPNIANESVHAQAREALKKYLFYFERYENHAKSLKLEEQTLSKITTRIQEKVMNNSGTWIDWQYLLDAAVLLKKCRYTLQYTYPYAYYMEKTARKQLFEYQQAQLEAEVENLSWKIERAEITDRGKMPLRKRSNLSLNRTKRRSVCAVKTGVRRFSRYLTASETCTPPKKFPVPQRKATSCLKRLKHQSPYFTGNIAVTPSPCHKKIRKALNRSPACNSDVNSESHIHFVKRLVHQSPRYTGKLGATPSPCHKRIRKALNPSPVSNGKRESNPPLDIYIHEEPDFGITPIESENVPEEQSDLETIIDLLH